MNHLPLPETLASLLVKEHCFATSYDRLGAEQRAIIKANIAMLSALYGEKQEISCLTRKLPAGYVFKQEEEPAAFALFFCSSSLDSAAHLLAALMPAILTGVESIVVCFIPGKDENTTQSLIETECEDICARISPALLVALELVGVENVFLLRQERHDIQFAKHLCKCGKGRMISVGDSLLASNAFCIGLDNKLPHIHLPTDSLKSEKAERIDDAFELSLDDSCQHFWVWPELSPEWFYNKSLHIGAL